MGARLASSRSFVTFPLALRPLGWRSDMFAGVSLAVVLGYWWCSGQSPAWQLASILAGACWGLLAACWISQVRQFECTPIAWLFGLTLLLRLIAVQAQPLLEDDHFRYLWDGLQTAASGNPYLFPPSHFFDQPALSPQWTDVLSGINNPDIPTIYGPLLQGLFVMAYAIAPGQVGAIQTLLMTFDLLLLVMLWRAGTPVRWLLVYAIHPLVLKESLNSAHPDLLLGLLLLAAVLAWQRHRVVLLGLLLGLALATKVSALVALPFFLLCPAQGVPNLLRREQLSWAARVLCLTLLSAALCYTPFLLQGATDWRALVVFGLQWHFNPLLYRMIEWFVPDSWARATAAACLMLVLAGCWLHWVRQLRHTVVGNVPPSPPVDTALLCLLLLSPVVNPWYWLWGLPVAIYRQNLLPVVFAMVAALSYVNSTVLGQIGGSLDSQGFSVPWYITLVQVSALLGLWAARAYTGPRHQHVSMSGA